KNKTFFYFTWEALRYPRQTTIQNTVPTSFARAGDFSREGVNIRDPYTGTPFPGNIIPSTRISPVAAQIIPYYPLPNTGRTDIRTRSNYRGNRPSDITSDKYEARVDHNFNSKNSFSARFVYKNNPSL